MLRILLLFLYLRLSVTCTLQVRCLKFSLRVPTATNAQARADVRTTVRERIDKMERRVTKGVLGLDRGAVDARVLQNGQHRVCDHLRPL